MTTHHSTAETFTTSLSGTFANISRATIQYFEHRARKARLANDMKLVLAMDPHMQSDVGLAGFSRLAPTQQESLLLDTIKHG
jgi:hypothetical protein